MALILPNRYPGRYNPPSIEYPQGSFKNRTAPGALDGSYLEQDWANDKEGFFQSLLDAAAIVPDDSVDEVGASQYYDALLAVIAAGLVVPDATATSKGIIEIATDAESAAGTDTERAVTPAGITASTLGRGQTWQDVTGSRANATTYTNITGRPIQLFINMLDSGTVIPAQFLIGGVAVMNFTDLGANIVINPIIPTGQTYRIELNGNSISTWWELR
tara:strand:+ start:7551 stop:8201 length:651 start_codon:yes stop_codon:yes gene_type:complete